MSVSDVVAVGAHPDDVILGAGGFLAKLSAAGHAVTLLCLTSGELGGSGRIREAEEVEAARCIGASVSFGRLEDGNITRRDAIEVISDCIRRLRPAMVFAHDPNDTHQDHVNVGRAATVASRTVENLFFYEGPSTIAFRPNSAIDVSDAWATKTQALAAYATQIEARKLMAWACAVSTFRAWPRHVGSQCESFRVAHAELSIRGIASSAEVMPAQPLLRDGQRFGGLFADG